MLQNTRKRPSVPSEAAMRIDSERQRIKQALPVKCLLRHSTLWVSARRLLQTISIEPRGQLASLIARDHQFLVVTHSDVDVEIMPRFDADDVIHVNVDNLCVPKALLGFGSNKHCSLSPSEDMGGELKYSILRLSSR